MPEHTELEIDSIISRQNVAKEGWTTYYVDGATGNDAANFLRWETAAKTIQAAIDKAESWAKIYIKAGTYAENVLITAGKDAIQLIGEQVDAAIIKPASSNPLKVEGDNCYVSSLTAYSQQAGQEGIKVKGTKNIFDNISLEGIAGAHAFLFSSSNRSILKNSYISDANITHGIVISGDAELCEIHNNYIKFPSATTSVLLHGTKKGKVYENEIVDAAQGIMGIAGSSDYSIYHNNFVNCTTNVFDFGTNKWFENFYDDHTVDTNNDGLCDTPYTFTTGTDYTPVSKRNGWLQGSLGASSATALILEMLSRPSIYLYEGWQDEASIDTTVWTITDPVAGTAWSRGASGAYLRAMAAPNSINNARLVSDQRWIAAPDTYGTNMILRKLVFEFELKLTNVANLEETETFFGLTTATGDKRSTNNIIGWAILSDVLQSVTDNGSAETVNTTFGETLTNWNKLKIEVYNGHVKFYINEVEVADHTTNLPDYPFYLNFYYEANGGAGAATIELGIIRVWSEDIAL